VKRIVLVKLTAASMSDKPGEDWHRIVESVVGELASSEELGGSLTDFSWTLGPYDAVIQVDLPSEEAAMGFSLTVSRKLRAETTTLTAVPESHMNSAMKFTNDQNGPTGAPPEPEEEQT
jgi:uncharacterized protein with GYD domain